MSDETILNELTSLQLYFEQGAKRCDRLRKQLLGQVSAPAPSGVNGLAKVVEITTRRAAYLERRLKRK